MKEKEQKANETIIVDDEYLLELAKKLDAARQLFNECHVQFWSALRTMYPEVRDGENWNYSFHERTLKQEERPDGERLAK